MARMPLAPKMGRGRKEVGSQLRFLLLISTISLSPLVSSVIGASSIRELRKAEQTKWHISQGSPVLRARPLSGSKLNSLNSTRSARQTPEIPALYSAPKIPTPEIPALYSAPEISPESQNEVDSSSDQGRATTEVSVEEMDDEDEEETSSEDIQYGVPTEKYPNSDDSNQEEESFSEHPTDSPSPTSRTNEPDQASDYNDPTEDSYSMGRDNSEKEPNNQYGPPSKDPSTQYGPPSKKPTTQYGPPSQGRSPTGQGRGNNGDKNGNGSRRTMYPADNQPTDQQQIENTVEPMSQTEQYYDDADGGAQDSFYLPPVHTSQLEGPQEEGDNGVSSQYDGDFDQYQQPPNPNYKTLPPDNNGKSAPASGGNPNRNFQDRPHDLSKQRSTPFPQQSSQSERPTQQGQDFGKDASSKPSSFYGPPGVNHVGSENPEDELEGLNEKIVDAELLQRVHQIIEDHENQQKLLLEGGQKNNGKGNSFGYPDSSAPSSQDYSRNELNGPTGFSSPGSSYTGYGSNSPTPTDYNKHGAGESDNDLAPVPYYGPPSFSSGYPNSNSLYEQGNPSEDGGSQSPRAGSGGDSSRQDGNRRVSSSSSQAAGGYNGSGRQGGNDNEPRKPSDVEYQKAILSRHFTESQPAASQPQFGENEAYRGSSGNNNASPGYQTNHQLNSFAGPGQEYLPPADNTKQDNELERNTPSSGYGRSFSSGDYGAQSQKPEDANTFSVKVATGIMVGDDRQATKSSALSPGYLPPAGTHAPSSRQQQGHDNSGEFYARQDESSIPGASKSPGSSPSKLSPAQLQPQRGGNSVPSFSQSPGSDPTFWSRNQLAPEPQTRYGPPSNGKSSTPFLPLGTSDNNNNNGGNGPSPFGAGFQEQNQINYSNGLGVQSSMDNDNNQRSQNPQQLYPVPQHTAALPATGSGNGGNNGVMVPRPIYGVPLAPVITLDSLGGIDSSSSQYSFDRGQAEGQSAPPNANYLPPSSTQYNSAQSSSAGQHLSSSFLSQSSPNDAIYGILANNPSSSASSTYLSIQGHNGNSNNHIYNINHNGYGASSGSSGSSSIILVPTPNNGDYDSSSMSIIPGLSNPFALPIYDYSPDSSHQLLQNDLRAGATSSTSTVVLPLEHFLEQLPHRPLAHSSMITSMDNLPAIIYGGTVKPQERGFRLTRRAVSKQASVSPVSNPNQKRLSRKASPPASIPRIKSKSPTG